jgi:hypothetical protein
MGMVAPRQRIASAYFVVCGKYGDVTRYAAEREVCRQCVYREANWLKNLLSRQQQALQHWQTRVRELEQRQGELELRLAKSVVLDEDKQAEVATVGQACGVTLRQCRQLLEVLIPGKVLSVSQLGRLTKAAGQKAGQLLAVMDELARQKVREAAADEIYVKDPVLMVVEPESLCWITGQLSEEVSGPAWQDAFDVLPNLEQVTRDGGSGLRKGVALVNAQRQERGETPLVDQGDHFHALRHGGVGLRKAQEQARKLLAQAEAAQKEVPARTRHGKTEQPAVTRARHAWARAEKAMDTWCDQERLWQTTKEALQLFTPTGDLNTRAQAQAVLAQTLPQLPDTFDQAKRHVPKAEMLNYLDRVQAKIAALPFPEEVKHAAVRQEGLRRRPEALQGASSQAAVLRGVLLMSAVVLGKVGPMGQQAVMAVREIVRRAYRASSLVECLNSVLRMQQAGHRRMTQGLLDLKRLSWNCHTFEGGRRRKTTPYQRLGVPWPEGLRWWDVLKLTPEQLRDKLSAAKVAP